ncbi:MAG: S8 family peptidase [Actinomycetota bacterium]
MRTRHTAAIIALLATSALPAVASAEGSGSSPLLNATAAEEWIVILDDGATSDVDTVLAQATATELAATGRSSDDLSAASLPVIHRYEHAVDGFAAEMSAATAKSLASHPDVAIVERNQTVSIDATWGQDRVDERDLPLDGAFNASGDGTGVHAYIIDTGVRTGHSDFGGRIGNGFTAIGSSAEDCNGHGTHVAGTVGGSTYGIAPDVTIHAVRVLGCNGSGSNAGVIAGVDWVAANAISPAVANMSLGGAPSAALDQAVANATSSGVTMVVAAGNSSTDACGNSPARAPSAITVGATTSSDARAGFSNFGSCLDIWAPGQDITSAWSTSNTATRTISGTSMAAPHVAGGAAIVLEADPSASPSAVTNTLLGNATTGVLSGIGSGSPNRLLFVGGGGGTPPPPPPPPTSGCDGSAESFSGSLSGRGDTEVEPNATYYFSSAGTHEGCLAGPSGTDFDLELYRWNGSGWSKVAEATSNDSNETLRYDGSSGYYLWVVRSFAGSGGYDFGLDRP